MASNTQKQCKMCGNVAYLLGVLGNTRWYRCRDCGWQQCSRPRRKGANK